MLIEHLLCARPYSEYFIYSFNSHNDSSKWYWYYYHPNFIYEENKVQSNELKWPEFINSNSSSLAP